MLEIDKIYCADCLTLMKDIPDKSIDFLAISYALMNQSVVHLCVINWNSHVYIPYDYLDSYEDMIRVFIKEKHSYLIR